MLKKRGTSILVCTCSSKGTPLVTLKDGFLHINEDAVYQPGEFIDALFGFHFTDEKFDSNPATGFVRMEARCPFCRKKFYIRIRAVEDNVYVPLAYYLIVRGSEEDEEPGLEIVSKHIKPIPAPAEAQEADMWDLLNILA